MVRYQRWSRGHKAQGQGHKKISRPRTDPLGAKDTDASDVLKKKVLKIFFQAISKKRSSKFFFRRSQKKDLQKFFSGDLKKKIFKNFFQAKKIFKRFFSGDLYLRKPKKKEFADFPQGFWRFPTKFLRFKNSAVLEPRTGQFSRACGFEAKAKDFKMCPRGFLLC